MIGVPPPQTPPVKTGQFTRRLIVIILVHQPAPRFRKGWRGMFHRYRITLDVADVVVEVLTPEATDALPEVTES